MKHCNSKRLIALAALLLMAVMLPMAAFAEGGDAAQPAVYATFWSLVPPIVAIALALITKEVYSSLFVGILIGGLLYAGGNPEGTVLHVFSDGIVSVLSNPSNVGILIFLVILGSIVAMMNKAGGSAAFGRWASSKIKTPAGAQLATIALGVLIFIDDYFNCLTVGSVMRPVTDKQNVSRAKLAYLIDATAAPVCIIAPISSWAAAVAGFVEGEDGFSLFIRAIPYNYYALLTIVMMVGMVLMHEEYGPMALHEANARKGDLFTTGNHPYEAMDEEAAAAGDNGHVMDLVIPIFSLIICCVIGMIYTGGFFEGADFVTAFSQSDASVGLALGGFSRHSDSHLCLVAEGNDRQPGRQGVCGGPGEGQRGHVCQPAARNHFPGGLLFGVCHRHQLGHIRHSDSHRGGCVLRNRPSTDDHCHFRLHGRCGLRRPLLAHFGYHHHGLGRCAV